MDAFCLFSWGKIWKENARKEKLKKKMQKRKFLFFLFSDFHKMQKNIQSYKRFLFIDSNGPGKEMFTDEPNK